MTRRNSFAEMTDIKRVEIWLGAVLDYARDMGMGSYVNEDEGFTPEQADAAELRNVDSYAAHNIMNADHGLVLRFNNGAEYRVTIHEHVPAKG